MIVYIDENLPAQLAHGLNLLEEGNDDGVTVHSISEIFGKGSPDEKWIPEIGKQKAFVITQDHNIHRKQNQKELYSKHKVGLIVFKGPGKHGYTYWEMVENIIKHWRDIKKEVVKQRPPFAFVIRPNSRKFQML
jgi:hypothetical protein